VIAYDRSPGGPRVKVPGALLTERAVTISNFRGQGGQFTYADLCSLTQLGLEDASLSYRASAGAKGRD
jgi:hypothetical protein